MKKFNYLVFLGILICVGACGSGNTKTQGKDPLQKDGWTLVWNDEFEVDGLPDPSKWSYDTEGNSWKWGNNEAQYYTEGRKSNAYIDNGTLKIVALKEEMEGFKYTSARLITKRKGDWLYGRFEIKAKLPTGLGTWPAIWMLPTDWEYGKWPASGEIDIMENVGFDPDTIVASAHTKSYNHIINTQRNAKVECKTSYTDFHVYTLEWDMNEYRVYLDDILFFTYVNDGTGPDSWPFDKKFHLILNVAIGGNWGGMKGIDDSAFPHIMEVDYVRVYQRN